MSGKLIKIIAAVLKEFMLLTVATVAMIAFFISIISMIGDYSLGDVAISVVFFLIVVVALKFSRLGRHMDN